MKIVFASAAILFTLIAFGAAPVYSDEKSDEAADKAAADKLPPATAASLRRLLSERIEIPDRFRSESVPLRTVTKFLVHEAVRQNQSLPVTVDFEAFKDASPDAGDIWEATIAFPKHLRSMTYRQVFEFSSSQVPAAGTFIIRDGVIVIFPGEFMVHQLLRSKIAVDIRGKSVVEAIEEISDRSGLTIAVDPRCDGGDKKGVTLRVDGGMSVRDILDSIADFHDLKVIVSPTRDLDATRVAVMPQVAYLKRLADQLREAKVRGKLELATPVGPLKNPKNFNPFR